ncbi:hypothetical protein [Streptomyces sp. NPDC053755]|uniref:hypothetical protein n=1 Tax=Streptomyces sp. NPDC053755 TaxID=3155815 RepID=UPI00341B2758
MAASPEIRSPRDHSRGHNHPTHLPPLLAAVERGDDVAVFELLDDVTADELAAATLRRTSGWSTWRAGGREALVMQPRGRPVGVHQVLGEAEQAAVRQAVLDHRPCDVGLGGHLWTRRLVGERIAKLYRVS